MLIQTAPGVNEIMRSAGGRYISIKKGVKMQMDHATAMLLIKEGLAVNAAYPEIRNNQIVVIEHRDEMGWRPVGRPQERDK